MATMPIHATVVPTLVAAQPNGEMAPAMLYPVDEMNGIFYKMAELPARGMRALHAAILKDLGVNLQSTGRYRTLAIELAEFIKRYENVSKAVYDTLDGTRRIWSDAVTHGFPTIYFRLRKGFAEAAAPGRSPHGWGCADDLALPDGPDPGDLLDPLNATVLDWLYTHETEYGFAHSTPRENWHVQWFAGDTVPPKVVDYENSLNKPPPPPEEDEDAMYLGIYITNDGRGTILKGLCAKDGTALYVSWVKTAADLAQLRANPRHLEFTQFRQGNFGSCILVGAVPPGWESSFSDYA